MDESKSGLFDGRISGWIPWMKALFSPTLTLLFWDRISLCSPDGSETHSFSLLINFISDKVDPEAALCTQMTGNTFYFKKVIFGSIHCYELGLMLEEGKWERNNQPDLNRDLSLEPTSQESWFPKSALWPSHVCRVMYSHRASHKEM